ncbi:hypothetical protein JIG36_51055 [Actinoplanes sp. LDG1-06]|uniref:DUF397 domain-containing protein n=1 Tax=Paractinoplanes ovalisporus TaxID=2810368 RepID=A0ABS2AVI8_9ACTN|nr:hypothetical protein [Actinoplanes ovalisporus]MBM2623859.1 hypothetical protein [Actinoplanes ovalisporus]
MTEHRYALSERVTLAFHAAPGDVPDVWVIEQPGPDGAGGQVRLTPDEWRHLVERIPHIRALAERVP